MLLLDAQIRDLEIDRLADRPVSAPSEAAYQPAHENRGQDRPGIETGLHADSEHGFNVRLREKEPGVLSGDEKEGDELDDPDSGDDDWEVAFGPAEASILVYLAGDERTPSFPVIGLVTNEDPNRSEEFSLSVLFLFILPGSHYGFFCIEDSLVCL
jgi:hypothetical protein